MDIKSQLLVEHSKKNTELIRECIGEDSAKFDELMLCFFGEVARVSQRAGMVVSAVFDHSPSLLQPYLNKMIENLKVETNHIAIKRNTIRILQYVNVSEEKISELFDHCLENIISTKEPIAIKAFSMTVLLNICKRYPELKMEVIPILELELERNESAGVINRGKKVLKYLHKL